MTPHKKIDFTKKKFHNYLQAQEMIKSLYKDYLHFPINSFENKSFIIFDWFLKSMKYFHHHDSNYDQDEIIKTIYCFIKKYCHKNYIS